MSSSKDCSQKPSLILKFRFSKLYTCLKQNDKGQSLTDTPSTANAVAIKPVTFPWFSKLPPELRLTIWTLALTAEQRIVMLGGDMKHIAPVPTVSALLFTNHESRVLAIKQGYEVVNDNVNGDFWFNYKLDTMFFIDSIALFMFIEREFEICTKLQNMIMPSDGKDDEQDYDVDFDWCMSALPNLKNITLERVARWGHVQRVIAEEGNGSATDQWRLLNRQVGSPNVTLLTRKELFGLVGRPENYVINYSPGFFDDNGMVIWD